MNFISALVFGMPFVRFLNFYGAMDRQKTGHQLNAIFGSRSKVSRNY